MNFIFSRIPVWHRYRIPARIYELSVQQARGIAEDYFRTARDDNRAAQELKEANAQRKKYSKTLSGIMSSMDRLMQELADKQKAIGSLTSKQAEANEQQMGQKDIDGLL